MFMEVQNEKVVKYDVYLPPGVTLPLGYPKGRIWQAGQIQTMPPPNI